MYTVIRGHLTKVQIHKLKEVKPITSSSYPLL